MMFDTIIHNLAFSIRFIDHFSGAPVAAELPVRIAGTLERPCRRADGTGRRQEDGTYRFLSLPAGVHRVLWREPFMRTQNGWARWDADPEVTLPSGDPLSPVDAELWPAANAVAAPSATGTRGKLIGPDPDGLSVHIAATGTTFDRFTRSDAAGEFLFLPPGRLPAGASGLIAMTIEVRAADGSLRPVAGWREGSGGAETAGADFTLTPRRVSRILFRLF